MTNDRLLEVLADLDAESEQVESWVRHLEPARWATPTPAAGWTVAHQIAHLVWTDEASLAAVEASAGDGDSFGRLMKLAMEDPTGFVDAEAARIAAAHPADLLERWRTSRAGLAAALRAVPEGTKVAWFGPPMSPTSMATARLMETWAHGHDVAEALGVVPARTSRVRHVCHLAVRTRGFAYLVRGLEQPTADVFVELRGTDGETWTWGAPDASQRVTGDAWDFALLAVRRRHLDDVDVTAVGPDAEHWLSIIQAFAGLPGEDPKPGSAR